VNLYQSLRQFVVGAPLDPLSRKTRHSLALVAFFAIFHGHAHGTELPPGQSAMLYSMGFVVATGGLHAAGIGLGESRRWAWGKGLLRAAGAIVAVGGVFFMWKALA